MSGEVINSTIVLVRIRGAATLVPDFEQDYGIASITLSFNERYAVFANYDGKSYHEGVSWIPSDWITLSFLMVESENPAFSIVFKNSFSLSIKMFFGSCC